MLFDFGFAKVITDPHLYETFGSGHFGYYPTRKFVGQLPPLDAVIISHSHRDHFDVPSLALIPRETPIFTPRDARIDYVLRQLQFTEVITVEDWTTISPCSELEIIWTPSAYRVPEHGLAIRYGEHRIWDMVDSVVEEREVTDRVAAMLGGPIDLLMAPVLPLLETAITDGQPPIYDAPILSETAELLRDIAPKCVLPFADGHYCLGRASWLNRQKFPASERRLRRLIRQALPEAILLDARPNDVLLPDGDGEGRWRVASDAGTLTNLVPSRQNREFQPSAEIPPLRSSRGAASGASFVGPRLAARLARGEVRLDLRLRGEYKFVDCVYNILLLGEHGSVVSRTSLMVDNDARVSVTPDTEVADIEVAVTVDDLAGLLSGRLGYSEAFLGGRLREWRPGAIRLEPVGIVIRPGAKAPRHGRVVVSGILLLNLLLRSEPGAVLRRLEYEIDQVRNGSVTLTPLFPATTDRFDSARTPVINPVARENLHLYPVFERIADAVVTHNGAASASGLYRLGDENTFVGVMGEGVWPTAEVAVRRGVVLLTNFLEAQPHLGSGVRFPSESYRALLSNIKESGLEVLRPTFAVPEDCEVPLWRSASLFPLSTVRLKADLSRLGWNGRIEDGERPGGPQVEWWQGLPPLIGARSYAGRFPHDHPLCFERTFLFEDARTEAPPRNLDILKSIVRADIRYSWVLMPEDTREHFEASRHTDFRRWIERQAVTAISGGRL